MDKEQKTIKPKIVFMGTSDFAVIILEAVVRCSPFTVQCVVTAPDKLVGRKQILTPPPVKILAEKYNIPVEQPERVLSIKYKVLSIKPDLIIVAAYGQIIPKGILDIPKYGCLNVHPSLLPRWRGASPIQYTILEGDEETGVTIILMDEKVDHGKIVSSIKYQVSSKITYPELHNKLAEIGAELLSKTIPDWMGKKITPLPQDEKKATYTKIIKKEDGKIDWRKPAQEIERQIRAFYPWPGSFASFNGRIIKILETDVASGETFSTEAKRRVGEVFLTKKEEQIAVQCGKNCLILKRLQIEGKKPMPVKEFLRGHADFIGAILK